MDQLQVHWLRKNDSLIWGLQNVSFDLASKHLSMLFQEERWQLGPVGSG